LPALERYVARTRLELGDQKLPFYERFHVSGSSSRYDLRASRVDRVFLYREDPHELLVEGEDYELEQRAGVIRFSSTPPEGETFIAEGESSVYFSDEEILLFLESAFALHTRNRNPKPVFETLPAEEVLLVAILAQIEALWVLRTSAAFDINIHAPEGMYIPRNQRFAQLSSVLEAAEARYKELSNALGTGLYAVEMFTLRRVSRLTGRYVPLYLDREVDDTRPPQRVFPPVSAQGAEVPEETVAKANIQVYQGRPFSETWQLTDEDGELVELFDYSEFTMILLRNKFQTSWFREIIPSFGVSVDVENSTVTVSLTSEDTAKLESTGAYVFVLKWHVEDDEIPLVGGRVLVESSLPKKATNVQIVG
jgi:hypothetical protein